MRKLEVFEVIEFEVEHPLFLARVQQYATGETAKVMLNEFERTSVPIFAIKILYLPKFERTSVTGEALADAKSAYRVLYEVSVIVGMSHLPDELMRLTGLAQLLAEVNPDPADWKEDYEQQFLKKD